MRVPNKHGRKRRAETTLLPALFLSLLVFFFILVLFCAVPAGADEEKLSLHLIDGEEIFVRSGNYHTFLQDYQIYVKGADTESNKVWIELRRNDVFLEDTIVREGDTFVYTNNSSEILNLTVDTIYAGADGVLVRFSPVYQYLDPKFPMPQKPDKSPANKSDNNSFTPTVFENQAEGFDMPLFLLSIGAVFLVTGFFAGLYKKKLFKK